MVGNLTDEQLDLPIRGICNDIGLLERIESGWTPRRAEAMMQVNRLKRRGIQTASKNAGIRHYLLFKSKSEAEHAKQRVSAAGFACELVDTGGGSALVVEQSLSSARLSIEHVILQLTEIARSAGGIYDAWEDGT